MNEQQLIKEIMKYCKDNSITGNINSPFKGYLVSFNIKLKKTYCKECGRKFSRPSSLIGERKNEFNKRRNY